MADGSAQPRPAPLDPAILAVVTALARWQARRDYEAAQQQTQASARRPLRPL